MQEPQQQQSKPIEIKTESKKIEPKEKTTQSSSKKSSNLEKVVPIKVQNTNQKEVDQPVTKTRQMETTNSFSESKSQLPPKPPAPPLPPPPPPQPGKLLLPPPDFSKYYNLYLLWYNKVHTFINVYY